MKTYLIEMNDSQVAYIRYALEQIKKVTAAHPDDDIKLLPDMFNDLADTPTINSFIS